MNFDSTIIIKQSNIIRWSCRPVSFKLFDMKISLQMIKVVFYNLQVLQKSYCNCVSNEINSPVLIRSIDLQRLLRLCHPQKRRSVLGNETKRSFSLIQTCFTLILGGFEWDFQGFSGWRTPKECVVSGLSQHRAVIWFIMMLRMAPVYNLHNYRPQTYSTAMQQH